MNVNANVSVNVTMFHVEREERQAANVSVESDCFELSCHPVRSSLGPRA